VIFRVSVPGFWFADTARISCASFSPATPIAGSRSPSSVSIRTLARFSCRALLMMRFPL